MPLIRWGNGAHLFIDGVWQIQSEFSRRPFRELAWLGVKASSDFFQGWQTTAKQRVVTMRLALPLIGSLWVYVNLAPWPNQSLRSTSTLNQPNFWKARSVSQSTGESSVQWLGHPTKRNGAEDKRGSLCECKYCRLLARSWQRVITA